MNTQYGNENLSNDDQLAYEFANESYKKEADRRKNIDGYELDEKLSNVNTAVYHHHGKKDTRVGHRGSTSGFDWYGSDTMIALGAEDHSSRHKKALQTTKDAHDKHGYTVMAHGHSLGQNISNVITEKLGEEDWYKGTIGFNAGVSHLGRANPFSKQRRECRRKKNRPKYCDKTTNIYEKNDYVSNNNALCSFATAGMGGKLCRKQVGYGNQKFYDHSSKSKNRFVNALTTTVNTVAPIRVFSNGKNHSLSVFEKKDRDDKSKS